MSLPYRQGQPGSERVYNATLWGAGFGTLVGTVRGAWSFAPARGETAVGGLSKALTTMGGNAVMFGGIALAFSSVEAMLETTRGVADWRNGALAGLAAGGVVGLRLGSLGAAASSGVLFCVTSCAVDFTNARLRSNPFSETGRPTNPYPVNLKGMASHHE